MPRFINPFTDWGFKRLFGQEFSKDLLISCLNDLLEGELHIKDVTFEDKEQLAETKDLRGCIFDVYCTTDDGKKFIVEKSEKQCESDFEKWIYVLKHMEALERMPFTAQKKIFKRLAEIADSSCLSKEEREKYEESRKAADDWYSGMYGSWISRNKAGLEEGLAKGEDQANTKIARKCYWLVSQTHLSASLQDCPWSKSTI